MIMAHLWEKFKMVMSKYNGNGNPIDHLKALKGWMNPIT